MFQSDPKMFQPHQMHAQDYLGNGVTNTTQDSVGNGINPMIQPPPQPYRPFEHLPAQPNPPVISSTQVPNSAPATGSSSTKSANWKSNEARRPKTYNCTACNKWFTSSGHLKRHYNTTLHKNAVKSSGQPDPATMPISVHHHPARDSTSREDSSGSPGEEARSGEESNSLPASQFDRVNVMPPGLIQQPPNGPYDRQPAPNIHHAPPLHSPMGHAAAPLVNPATLSSVSANGSPPNGEAGPSPTTNLDSRGLLLSSTPNHTMGNTPPVQVHGFNMATTPMMPMENSQFPMYPNELAPHVTQAMVINSLNTTGEFHQLTAVTAPDMQQQQQELAQQQPLPSFSQFHIPRMGLLIGSSEDANVGGGGSATTPYIPYYSDQYELTEVRGLVCHQDDDIQYSAFMQVESEICPQEMILSHAPSESTLSATMNNSLPYASSEDTLSSSMNNNLTYVLSDSPTMINNNTLSPTMINNNNNDVDDSLIIAECDTQIQFDSSKEEIEVQAQSPIEQQTINKKDYEDVSTQVVSSTVTVKSVCKCHVCNKKFNKACYLTQHNKTFHSGDKPFKCSRCGKRFSDEGVFKEHQSKHAGEKPHKCELCPKQFNHKTDLRRHMCLHTGLKPYSCDSCGKGFIRKDHMLKHCETHQRKAKAKANSRIIGETG